MGYGYVRDTLERLNIEPGEFCESYVNMMDRKRTSAKVRKSKQEVKKGNQLTCQKNSKLAKKEKNEGKTYKSNVGLNLQVNTEETSFDPLQITESVTKDQHERYEK